MEGEGERSSQTQAQGLGILHAEDSQDELLLAVSSEEVSAEEVKLLKLLPGIVF